MRSSASHCPWWITPILCAMTIPLALVGGGCASAPGAHQETPSSATEPRVLTAQMIAILQRGVSRQDVLLQLGEPDFWWEQQRIFAYQWSMRTPDVPWLESGNGRGAGSDGVYLKFHALLIEFDAAGKLKYWQQFASDAAALTERGVSPRPDCSISQLKFRWRPTGAG